MVELDSPFLPHPLHPPIYEYFKLDLLFSVIGRKKLQFIGNTRRKCRQQKTQSVQRQKLQWIEHKKSTSIRIKQGKLKIKRVHDYVPLTTRTARFRSLFQGSIFILKGDQSLSIQSI